MRANKLPRRLPFCSFIRFLPYFFSLPLPSFVFQFFFPFFSLLCSHSAFSASRRETWFTEVTFYAEFSRAERCPLTVEESLPSSRSVNAVSKRWRVANVFPVKGKTRASVLYALLLKRDSGLTEFIEKFCSTAVEIGVLASWSSLHVPFCSARWNNHICGIHSGYLHLYLIRQSIEQYVCTYEHSHISDFIEPIGPMKNREVRCCSCVDTF